MGRRCDANGPGRTGRSRTRGMVCFVAYRGLCICRNRDINDDLTEEFTSWIEYLYAIVPTVCHINIVVGVNGKAVRSVELAGFVSGFTPGLQPIALFIDFGDS